MSREVFPAAGNAVGPEAQEGGPGQGRYDGRVRFKIYLKPLVTWIWIGGMGLTIGTVICLIPSEPGRKKPVKKRKKTTASREKAVTA